MLAGGIKIKMAVIQVCPGNILIKSGITSTDLAI